MAMEVISICMEVSNGIPVGFPRGKSVKRNLGTPHCSMMSLADPAMTVGMPLDSKCRATRPTVWWHTGHNGTSRAASTLSSSSQFCICGA